MVECFSREENVVGSRRKCFVIQGAFIAGHLASIKNNEPSKSSVAEDALTNLHLNFKPMNQAVESKEFKLLKVVTNPMGLNAYEKVSTSSTRHAKKKSIV